MSIFSIDDSPAEPEAAPPLTGAQMRVLTDNNLRRITRQTERAITVIWAIGMIGLALFIAWGLLREGGVHFLTWAVIAALAAALSGGALGLLFGLPTAFSGPPYPRAPDPVAHSPAIPAAPSSDTSQVTETRTVVTSTTTGSALDLTRFETGYRDSTSLEQIADWLTKIIVGLTLTQYATWEEKFRNLAHNLTETLLGPAPLSPACLELVRGVAPAARGTALANPICAASEAAAVPGGILIALFAVGGFLLSYLWMRRYFILEMVIAKREAIDALAVVGADAERMRAEAVKAAEEARREADRLTAESRLTQLRLEAAAEEKRLEQLRAEQAKSIEAAKRDRLVEAEPARAAPRQAVDAILKKAAAQLPAQAEEIGRIRQAVASPTTDRDDPWRGKFGGASLANNASLGGLVSPLATDPNFFKVSLEVLALSGERATEMAGKKAVYFLHPTFGDDPRVSIFGSDGRAPLEFYAYGAFTVGVLMEDGTKLELNLATLDSAPDRFRQL